MEEKSKGRWCSGWTSERLLPRNTSVLNNATRSLPQMAARLPRSIPRYSAEIEQPSTGNTYHRGHSETILKKHRYKSASASVRIHCQNIFGILSVDTDRFVLCYITYEKQQQPLTSEPEFRPLSIPALDSTPSSTLLFQSSSPQHRR